MNSASSIVDSASRPQLGESIVVLGEFERQKELVLGFLAVYLMETCLYLNGSI